MSGGSYNYLCHASDLDDLVTKRADMEAMAERLEGLPALQFPGAAAAAARTRSLLAYLQTWEAHTRAETSLLAGVWKAVEWWDSADSGPAGVVEALAQMLTPDPAAPGRTPFMVERTVEPLRYFGHCPWCKETTSSWVGDEALATATAWATGHREECPKRCPELVPSGGGVRCDRHAGHPLEGRFGGHSWGTGPYTRL